MSPHKDSMASKAFGTIVVLVMLLQGAAGLAAAGDGPREDLRSGYAPWWDYNWIYRRPLAVDNTQNPKALSDYQLLINLSAGDLIAGGKMRPDYGDMRFTDADGTTPLKYYMETEGNVWVKVPSIPASSKKNIYLYYGNPSATTASNASNVFDLYDHFEGASLDTDTWMLMNEGSYSVAQSEFTIAADGNYQPGKAIAQKLSTDQSYILRARFKIIGGIHVDERIGLSIKCNTQDARGYNYVMRDFTGLDEISFLDDYVAWNSRAGNWQKDTWCIEDIYHDGTNVKARLNDGAWQSQAWSGRSGLPALYFGSYDGVSVWDWALVRKFILPEPRVTMGNEEHPFKFVSAECSSLQPNAGDRITVNVTFNNPVTEPTVINVSFREGEEFADANRWPTQEVMLGPKRDTVVSVNWTAVGGNTVIWVHMDELVLASFPLSVNWLPELDYIPDQRLMQDQPYLLRLSARDKGGEALNWTEDCPLFKFNRTNGTGAEISFRPTNDDVGVFFANFTVTDPKGCVDSQKVRFSVENLNDPPALERIPDLVAYQDSRFNYRVNASDPDQKWGDTLSFSDDCFLFDIDPKNGNFSFLPTNAQVGRYVVEIAVTDNQSVSSVRTLNLTVQNQNDPPAIDAIPPQTATQGKLWQVMARASDPDQSTPQSDRLRFSDDSPLFDINPDSGLITFTPANKDVGLRPCNITVTDMAGASASTRLDLRVLNVNDPPSLEAIPDLSATEEVPFEYTARAFDADVGLKLDNLTFTDDSALFDIDPKTGTLSFTPTNAQVGRHTIKITVKDDGGATASRSFILTVLNVNDPPFNVAITSLSAEIKYRPNELVWLNGTGSDEDAGDRLSFVWLDNGVEAGRGKSIQVKFGPGDHTVTLKVSDGNATVSSEVTIKVARSSKEQVTVQNDSWIILVVVVLAAAGAGGAFLAFKRSQRKEPEESGDMRVAAPGTTAVAVPAPKSKLRKASSAKPAEAAPAAAVAATAAAASAPPAKVAPAASAADKDKRDKAQKALNSAEDALADALESGADTTEAMENLDIAKDFFKDGDYDEAITYAGETVSALKPPAGKAGGAPKRDLGKLACPGCGEELSPEWGVCPVCGHKTR